MEEDFGVESRACFEFVLVRVIVVVNDSFKTVRIESSVDVDFEDLRRDGQVVAIFNRYRVVVRVVKADVFYNRSNDDPKDGRDARLVKAAKSSNFKQPCHQDGENEQICKYQHTQAVNIV